MGRVNKAKETCNQEEEELLLKKLLKKNLGETVLSGTVQTKNAKKSLQVNLLVYNKWVDTQKCSKEKVENKYQSSINK